MSGKGAKGLSGKGAKGTMGDKEDDKKRPVSRSSRAGLQFPVGRVHRLLKVTGSPLEIQKSRVHNTICNFFLGRFVDKSVFL